MTQMNAKKIAQYDHPDHFLPLVPGEHRSAHLYEKAGELVRRATQLGAMPTVGQGALKPLLRKMNSYYTNKIEGQHVCPSDIDRALVKDFSENADIARKQRLAIAHIDAEVRCEQYIEQMVRDGGDQIGFLYSAEALQLIHKNLFEHVTPEDLLQPDGSVMIPGVFRTRNVAVGKHEAPTATSLMAFMGRWGETYSRTRRGEASVIAVAASHHRLAWVHPFLDGNGRTSRLHTHLLFHALGLSSGLWSPLRGFARSEDRYKALLQAADEHRRGDLDGRGNLTERGLVDWIDYVLDVCTDQVNFMSQNLKQEGLFDRIAASLAFDETTLRNGVRQEALRPLQFLYAVQSEMTRAEFKELTGLGVRVATSLLSALLKAGYLESDSPHGNIRFGVPSHALRFYFPALWPEAEQDQALIASSR